MGGIMELRHLRYFVAVAEEGSLTVAAERRLHTAQPSLSRQMRDLEYEVGTQLMVRSARGVELTAAGRVFLDHARLALIQVEAAREAARRAAEPTKPSFALGFLTGQELDWLPEAMRILHDELPNMQVTISSQYSPDLADALMRGKLDVAFMRPEARAPDLTYRLVRKEPLVAVLPSDHRLASREAIDAREIAGETFISVSNTAPTLRIVIDDYLKSIGLDIRPDHEVDNIAMAMSLVASTRGVALLPAYVRNFMPWSVISRPIMGDPPTIDLVIGYSKANASPTLKLFLSRADELIGRVSKRLSHPADEAREREESRQETREKSWISEAEHRAKHRANLRANIQDNLRETLDESPGKSP
jgi:LysR family hca operon transcriptional activator